MNKKAFTLIELLVVVLIVGILAAVALPQYQVAVLKTRATQLIIAANAIRQAQEAYYLANGSYGIDFNDLGISISGCKVSSDGRYCTAKSFSCTVNDGYKISGNPVGQAYCQGNGLLYGVTQMSTQAIVNCVAYTAQAKQVCENFGGKNKRVVSDNEVWYNMP